MKKILIIISILSSLVKPQVDSTSQFDFFPLHIGDIWQYRRTNNIYGNPDTTYYFIEQVVGDTTMPNGIYYYTIAIDGNINKYLRVDTSLSEVYQYNEGLCTNDEMNLFPLISFNDSSLIWFNC